MAILKEISESEAEELFGRKSSQDRREVDRAEDSELAWDPLRDRPPSSRASLLDEVLRRVSDLEHVLPQPPREEGSGFRRSRGQPDRENEIRADSSSQDVGDRHRDSSKGKKPGAGEAVLLGALATGVNGPTWFLIKVVLVALAASLLLLLHVAVRSSSTMVLLNVIFLIIIAGGLALGLIWYVSQVGLVTVEKQMSELNLTDEASESGTKKTK